MKRAIYKEYFGSVPTAEGDPLGFFVKGTDLKVINVSQQEPAFWFEFTPDDNVQSDFQIMTQWTGYEFDLDDSWQYVGSTTIATLVFHVWWRPV